MTHIPTIIFPLMITNQIFSYLPKQLRERQQQNMWHYIYRVFICFCTLRYSIFFFLRYTALNSHAFTF